MTNRTWPDLSDEQLEAILAELQAGPPDSMASISFERVMQQLMRERDELRAALGARKTT